MTVIHKTSLLTRRLADLQRRRDGLVDRQERLRRALPEWAFAPLQLAGMSVDEIRTMMTDLSNAESDAGLDQIDQELERIDSQIEEIENQLLAVPARSLENIQAILDLALVRFKRQTVSDPRDLYFDYGEARVLAFLERATTDLRGLLNEAHRDAG